jgi:hypothetical protein
MVFFRIWMLPEAKASGSGNHAGTLAVLYGLRCLTTKTGNNIVQPAHAGL